MVRARSDALLYVLLMRVLIRQTVVEHCCRVHTFECLGGGNVCNIRAGRCNTMGFGSGRDCLGIECRQYIKLTVIAKAFVTLSTVSLVS